MYGSFIQVKYLPEDLSKEKVKIEKVSNYWPDINSDYIKLWSMNIDKHTCRMKTDRFTPSNKEP